MLSLASCRSTKKISTAISKKDTTQTVVINPVINPVGKPIDHSHDDSINYMMENYRAIAKNHIDFTTFSARINVDYEDANGKKYNVTGHLRMYKDSVIWISITAIFGIEGLRAYITKDSVKVLDKQNKIYSARSVSYLQDVSALPLDLSTLQDLLLGNPVFLDSAMVSYNRASGVITMLSYGESFKNQVTIGETDKLLQSSKLDDVDEVRNRTCYLTYSDYDKSKGVNFPTIRSISVTEKKKLDIKLDFKVYDFNETLSFPFSVPKNYKSN